MTDPDNGGEARLPREERLIKPHPPASGAAGTDTDRVVPEPAVDAHEAAERSAALGGQVAADRLVDETGATIEVSPEKEVHVAAPEVAAVGATGPTNWWRIGLIAVAIVAAILFALQLMTAGPADTDAPSPGEPEAVIEEPAPAPADPAIAD